MFHKQIKIFIKTMIKIRTKMANKTNTKKTNSRYILTMKKKTLRKMIL